MMFSEVSLLVSLATVLGATWPLPLIISTKRESYMSGSNLMLQYLRVVRKIV